ncbi:C2H2-type zinc finger transcription factor [Phycomyces blakesleeanus NRRL 1555(-)]|uniref:C2H2-type zinc finger transcription factor n=1 Tax=Phycomyces blakesleeanus (strain ATCC 8743b / DSM 1359 / FGSC 10004 / NBRC 33097 / NRRL 1555) TaxID=763407 RepID=A0A162XTP7_PHYB8|nr:C2H2-type zinc finger transcription factor [Phycomyces blakesleeanus NRRL 1555(-)]OAD76485.1 C2H2-type zinc finger transcription factor [Phycomyces blakesleeanus NRRL 1555(-)]|eukprot:XP_018294525.1 C2H2-type zinc finger transcription factor [Phycomyces blakesleeanus NRRL 1555(-)]
MSTSRPLPVYNYEDYVPIEGISCPICGNPCGSLQDLNKHLDVAHNEEDTKGAFLSWFGNAQRKVQNTLSVGPNSRYLGSSPNTNAVERSLRQLVDPALMSSFNNFSLGNNNPVFFASDNERQGTEFITREHWQRESNNDMCSLPGCGKTLGRNGAGKQHCRKCGRLFCETHTQYEIKLNRQACHDPENGVWCKVCVGCYIGRERYMENQGATRNLSKMFLEQRAKTIDRVYLDSNRLEKRLEKKLARIHYNSDTGVKGHERPTSLLTSPASSLRSITLERSESSSSKDSFSSMIAPNSPLVSSGNSILSMKLKYRDGEQTVAKWQDDRTVTKCPLCLQSFTLTNRKHHCRLCGDVVCGNVRCSKMIPLFLNMSSDTFDEEPVGDTRACCKCQRAVFRRKTKHEESLRPLPIFPLYHQLSLTREKIEKQLPKFHDTIIMLEKEKTSQKSRQTHESYQVAAQIRKSLLDNFALYDTLSKSIRSLPAPTAPMKRLQTNICTAANLYLQRNMLPLQMLPRLLKPEKKNQNTSNQSLNGSPDPTATWKQDIRMQIQAYKEQYGLVEGFIRDAQKERRIDDVKTLKNSLDELRVEIDKLQAQLAS